ncbi:DNA repair protein RadA [Halanaerobium salsuginis]|jgi:DNA repair protein RadA/Sms|uniref:DNA repair protein RadA n=1 Tax=Halanaerobium salsuginis TaxID=29563 RepID=A0A1I4MHR2_9FIRM|nr:DNA repair protein RadA [Halanaerobium salsuginis]SFM02734.1 DNA repair protein RadA/Sms [Halanaerobium salsuginis]
MAKTKKYYLCQECGYKSINWMGKCSNCGSWDSFEEITETDSKKENIRERVDNKPLPITEVTSSNRQRYKTDIKELDRVLGGGIVSGSLVLLGGAPGIGKSTLILQVASLFSQKYGKTLYLSGEESAPQVKMRAERLDCLNPRLNILAETDYLVLENHLLKNNDYSLIVVDSIQTVHIPELEAAPGNLTQIKEVTNRLLKLAKTLAIPIVLIGHVTKEGELAGPRVLEHLVDTVLQFEGDNYHMYRMLRSRKNRFGSTNEIGVFEMKENGIQAVANPSSFFINERPDNVSGSIITPALEGSRVILVEVQALVTSAAFAAPQRLANGVDYKRVSLLLAVLEKRLGVNFKDQDVNVNITGGIRVEEPGLDLAIIAAVISSYRDYSLDNKTAVIGEVGLSGEVRAVGQIEKRISELKKLGFKKIIVPAGNAKNLAFDPELAIDGVTNIAEFIKLVLGKN